MSDKLFDKHIKSKLDNLEINADKAGWEAFNAKHGDVIGDDSSDAAFDDVIKNKVSNLNDIPEQASWAAFAEKFADDLTDQDTDSFDAVVKDKVKDISVEKPIAAWAAFEAARLSELEDLSFDQFDSVLKDKLSDIPVSPSADWEHFEEKLDSELVSADNFDASLKERMENFRVPFEPSHWAIMKQRLERVKYIKERLYTSKALELVMLFLLVFTIGNNVSLFKNNKLSTPVKVSQPMADITEAISETKLDQSEVISTPTNQSNKIIKSTTLAIEVDNQTKNLIQSSIVEDKKTSKDLNPFSASEGSTNSIALLAEATNNIPSAIVPSNQITNRNTSPQKTIENSSKGFKLAPKVFASQIQLEQLEQKSLVLDAKKRSLLIDNQNLQNVGLKPAVASTNGVWFHSLFSIDRNYIQSYYGKAVTEDPYSMVSQGYSMGILLGLEREKMGISTGVQFGNYVYTPEKKEERYYRKVDGQGAYYKISLAMIEHNTINIPLNFDYKLLPAQSKWNITALAGASLNLITSTNYDIQNELDEKLPDNVPQPSSWQYPEEFAGKNYLQGLNQGGSFSETASLYLKAGLGIQRTFGNALALYVQPSYQYQLLNNRIHPNLDHINRLSINMGMKFKFVMPER